jgi:pimeloyl-ACP methyl ester carboxylesterase
MKNLRTYGERPFSTAVVHGGPGAPGYMAPVARELSRDRGVLEPLQTATSLRGQVEELLAVLQEHADLPVTLIGSSWGAMLGYIFASRHPDYVKKLIMVGSGVFEEHYAAGIGETRLSRLSEGDRAEAYRLKQALRDPEVADKNVPLAQLSDLFTRADAYDPLTLDLEMLEVQHDVNESVWRDAEELRRSGELLALGKQVRCPVLAIHGDHDPHPAEGVRDPLSAVIKDFRFVLLENCGHYPWLERQARDHFYAMLREEC